MVGETSTTGSGNSFVTQDDTLGLRPLNVSTEYAAVYGTATATDNVSLNAGVTGAVAKTFNALRLDASGGGHTLEGAAGNTLTLTSGALLMTAGVTDNDVTITGFDQILAGANDAVEDELVVFTTSTHATAAGATLTIASSIGNHGTAATGVTKAGNGTLVLSHAANTYTGTTIINQGVLEFASAGSLGGGTIRMSGGTLRWGAGNTTDITASGRVVDFYGPTVFVTPTGGGGIVNTGNVFDVGANDVVLNGNLGNGRDGSLIKRGTGTLTVNNATYRGATVVAQGTMNFGTIAANTMEGLYLIGTNTTINSTVQNGLNVQSLIVGGVYGAAEGVTGNLTVGGGAVNIGDGGNDDFVAVGFRDATALAATVANLHTVGKADFRLASSVNINVARILVGAYQGAVSGNGFNSTGNLLLSNTINTIKAHSFILGFSPAAVTNSGGTSTMNLGTGTTTFNVDTFVVGGIRSKATVTIGVGGTFTLRGFDGGSAAADLFIGDNDMVGTGTSNESLLDLTGAGNVDMLVNTLVLGRFGSGAGYGRGTLTIAAGVLEASTVRMADHEYGAAVPATNLNTKGLINQSGTAVFRIGTLSQGTGEAKYNWEGGTIENIAGRNLTNQNVTITFSGTGTAGDTTLRTFNVSENQQATFEAAAEFSGTGSFTKAGLGEMVLKGVNLNSGNLRVTGGRVSLRDAGTMDDVSWVNLGTGTAFDVKNRTGASYTTDAVVSGTGTIDATGGTFTVGSGVGATSRAGVLRPGSSSVVSGTVTSSTATVGDATGSLTVLGGLNLAGSAARLDRLVLQVGGTTRNISSTFGSFASTAAWVDSIPGSHAAFLAGSSGTSDYLDVQGALTLNANGGITVAATNGYTGAFGDVFNLLDWTSIVNNGFTVPNRYDDGTAAGLMFDLPTLSSGLTWDTSLFLDYGTVVVVPEPSRVVLGLMGVVGMIMRRRRK